VLMVLYGLPWAWTGGETPGGVGGGGRLPLFLPKLRATLNIPIIIFIIMIID
jgi:hypothetical protein